MGNNPEVPLHLSNFSKYLNIESETDATHPESSSQLPLLLNNFQWAKLKCTSFLWKQQFLFSKSIW